jgi:hypothetical protein
MMCKLQDGCSRPWIWHKAGGQSRLSFAPRRASLVYGAGGASGGRPGIGWHPVYGWFTDGFDTQDLHDAKVLPADLR